MTEAEENRKLIAWQNREILFLDLIRYVRAHAPRCTIGCCNSPAYWSQGIDLACDKHKRPKAAPIPGSDVVRKVCVGV